MDYSHLLGNEEEQNTEILSVADFLGYINKKLVSERHRVQGEVTSINKNYGKAIYFSIKDSEKEAKLDCVIWKSVYDANGIEVNVGDEIIITGNPEIYAPQGRFSMKVSTLEYAGEGALKKAYDELKKKLTDNGTLDRERRPLPRYPRKIGIITSLSGVVIHDFTTNLEQRGYQLEVIDSRVEGKDAIHDLFASLKTFAKKDIDLLVIMRGGGSWESLQAFNTESVVQMIADFPHPVLTGIGHDVDVTLAELVADQGASTPTAVAKTINEPWKILINYLQNAEVKTFGRFSQTLLSTENSLERQSASLKSVFIQKIHEIQETLQRSLQKNQNLFKEIIQKTQRLDHTFQGLLERLRGRITNQKESLERDKKTLTLEIKKNIGRIREEIGRIARNIEQYNPERLLEQGYSILYKGDTIVRSKKDLKKGDQITTQVADGSVTSEITHII